MGFSHIEMNETAKKNLKCPKDHKKRKIKPCRTSHKYFKRIKISETPKQNLKMTKKSQTEILNLVALHTNISKSKFRCLLKYLGLVKYISMANEMKGCNSYNFLNVNECRIEVFLIDLTPMLNKNFDNNSGQCIEVLINLSAFCLRLSSDSKL